MSWSCEHCGGGRSDNHQICNLTSMLDTVDDTIDRLNDNLVQFGEQTTLRISFGLVLIIIPFWVTWIAYLYVVHSMPADMAITLSTLGGLMIGLGSYLLGWKKEKK